LTQRGPKPTSIIPWRIKNFVSEHWPLAYHLVANRFGDGNSQQHWNASLANTWDAPNRNWPGKISAITQLLEPPMAIIDVGCGTGSILRALQQQGFMNIHGLELSDFAVQRLIEQGLSVSEGSLLNMPFSSGRFDAAIASEVLEHIIRRGRFLKELSRIVKSDGAILIFVPDNCLGPIDEPEHVIKYNSNSLEKFLSKFVTVESITSLVEPHTGARSLFAICRN
jgi:ubiquinone/menaquinone biosynthesis C-methylase UbiE